MTTAAAFKLLAEPLVNIIDNNEDLRELVSIAYNRLPKHEQDAYSKGYYRSGVERRIISECAICGRLGTNGGHGDYEPDKFTSAEQLAHYAQAMADGP